MPSPKTGDSYTFFGNWEKHSKYGEQFKAISFTIKTPSTVAGIEAFLASGLISDVGPELASRIVEIFGLETLHILDNEPDRLTVVHGIGPVRAQSILKAWNEHKIIRDTMIFLFENGITGATAAKILKQFGAQTVSVIKNNPYILTEIHGIGFQTADRIALQTGISPNSPARIQAGIIYGLEASTQHGHTYLPKELLIRGCVKLLNVERNHITDEIMSMIDAGKLFLEETPGMPESSHAVYHPHLYRAETSVASQLRRLLDAGRPWSFLDPERIIEIMAHKHGLELSAEQQTAVYTAAQSRVIVINGGPGTGKSTVIKAIIELFSTLPSLNESQPVLLCAPTGKAAKRMSEVADGIEAKTIHRALQYNFQEDQFTKNSSDPLPHRAVVVDEVSMVDIHLFHHLLDAIEPGTSLILVGDTAQLPAIGPGNVLKDIISSKAVPVITLETVYRQAENSTIKTNCHRILWKQPLVFSDKNDGDFFFIPETNPDRALTIIVHLVSKILPEKYGISPRNIIVLTPMKKTALGVNSLNDHLQQTLNPHGKQVRDMRVGDPVMCTANNYELEVFNGETGVLVDADNRTALVDFDGRIVAFGEADIGDLVPTYATTVHKSQGSEYDCVIVPLTEQHHVMLANNLIYTACSRAKKRCFLVGSHNALMHAIRNDRTKIRYTRLADRLMDN